MKKGAVKSKGKRVAVRKNRTTVKRKESARKAVRPQINLHRQKEYEDETMYRYSPEDEEDVPYYSDEEDLIEEERLRKEELVEELQDFLAYRPDFVVIGFKDDWAVLAKVSVFRINNITNSTGFQPLDKTHERKICFLTIVEFGDEPRRGELPYVLKKAGCVDTVKLRSKYDINSKLAGL